MSKNQLKVLDNGIESQIRIVKEDTVDLIVSKFESYHMDLRTKVDGEKKVLNGVKDKVKKNLKKLLTNMCKTKYSKMMEPVAKLLSPFSGIEAVCKYTVYSNNNINNGGSDTYVQFRPTIEIGSTSIHGIEGKAKMTKAALKLEKEIKDLRFRISVLDEKGYAIRKALDSLPTVERRARALLAEKALGSSENGRMLLKDLLSDETIKSLPMVKYDA